MHEKTNLKVLDNPIIEQLVGELRDKTTKPREFRQALHKLGVLMAYEVARELDVETQQVETPLGIATYNKIADEISLISVLRAAIPFVDGFMEAFPDAQVGIVGASRRQLAKERFTADINYKNVSDVDKRVVIVPDPMLATGTTLIEVLDYVLELGAPKKVIICSAISASYGIDRILERYPSFKIYTAALDEVLDDKGYIVPGLGDAGARTFNTKH